jgi:hypothetical protein
MKRLFRVIAALLAWCIVSTDYTYGIFRPEFKATVQKYLSAIPRFGYYFMTREQRLAYDYKNLAKEIETLQKKLTESPHSTELQQKKIAAQEKLKSLVQHNRNFFIDLNALEKSVEMSFGMGLNKSEVRAPAFLFNSFIQQREQTIEKIKNGQGFDISKPLYNYNRLTEQKQR